MGGFYWVYRQMEGGAPRPVRPAKGGMGLLSGSGEREAGGLSPKKDPLYNFLTSDYDILWEQDLK